MRLKEIPSGTRVLVDTNIFIYALRERSKECADFLRRCASGDVHGAMTPVVLAELAHRLMVAKAIVKGIVKPPHAGAELKRRWKEVAEKLTTYREQMKAVLEMGLEILPVSEGAVRGALDLQARYGLLAGDSLNLAVARENGLADVASNDEDLGRVEGLRLWRPGDLSFGSGGMRSS